MFPVVDTKEKLEGYKTSKEQREERA